MSDVSIRKIHQEILAEDFVGETSSLIDPNSSDSQLDCGGFILEEECPRGSGQGFTWKFLEGFLGGTFVKRSEEILDGLVVDLDNLRGGDQRGA